MTEITDVLCYTNGKEQFTNTSLIDFSCLEDESFTIYADDVGSLDIYTTPFILCLDNYKHFQTVEVHIDKDKKDTSVKFKSSYYQTEIEEAYKNNKLVEINKCLNSKDKIDSELLFKTIINKIKDAMLEHSSKPMNTAVVKNAIHFSIKVQELNYEINELKQALKQKEDALRQVSLTEYSIQNDLFLR